jgi:tRNA 2-selenouridine synthase
MLQILKSNELFDMQSVNPAILVDVRSESEFAEAHIPGSLSLPLLSDEERVEVGTIYKKISQEAARRRGVEIVRPKIRSFADAFKSLLDDQCAPFGFTDAQLISAFDRVLEKLWPSAMTPAPFVTALPSSWPKIIFYCWRGGARSQSMALLAECLGFDVGIIEGGHQAFRQEVQDFIAQEKYPFEISVVYGFTGSGKTTLLKRWMSEGRAVIDLEALACHRGSAFGQIGIQKFGRQKEFEAGLYWKMKEYARAGVESVFVEGESQRIGLCAIPERFFNAMAEGPHILLECPLEQRVQNILSEYVSPFLSSGTEVSENTLSRRYAVSTVCDAEIHLRESAERALNGIKKRLGGELYSSMLTLLKAGDYESFTRELLVHYYDKIYLRSHDSAKEYASVIKF